MRPVAPSRLCLTGGFMGQHRPRAPWPWRPGRPAGAGADGRTRRSRARYTDPVTSVADDLRTRTTARVLAMTIAERIALALALGDDDLAQFVRSSGLEPSVALRRLRARRQDGRTPSACTGDDCP